MGETGSKKYQRIQPLWDMINEIGNSLNLSNWMGGLPDRCLDQPLVYLAIPGSHNSMSYTIEPFAAPAPDIKLAQKKYIPYCVRPWMRKWCRTQNIDVIKQLHCGVRYLDLRVCTKKESHQLFYVHGLYGGEVKRELKKVKKFLLNHKKEIVILDFQHFYQMGFEEHSKLIAQISDIFGPLICPIPVHPHEVTLRYLYEHNYQVIVIYRYQLNSNKVWSTNQWRTYWADTMSTEIMIDTCDDAIGGRHGRHGVVTQCILTPTAKTLLIPWGNVKHNCALKAFTPILVWLNRCVIDRIPLNVVIADYIQIKKNLFAKAVISTEYSPTKDYNFRIFESESRESRTSL